jgi:hypothetical protein
MSVIEPVRRLTQPDRHDAFELTSALVPRALGDDLRVGARQRRAGLPIGQRRTARLEHLDVRDHRQHAVAHLLHAVAISIMALPTLVLSKGVACLALTLALMGCTERAAGTGQAPAASAVPAVADARFDAWLGQWDGVEGTSLQLAGGKGRYEVTISNLDGPRSFQGSAVSDGIAFERDGSREVIRATNGVGTGMKWLAEKTNCLAARPGEGWCRH